MTLIVNELPTRFLCGVTIKYLLDVYLEYVSGERGHLFHFDRKEISPASKNVSITALAYSATRDKYVFMGNNFLFSFSTGERHGFRSEISKY